MTEMQAALLLTQFERLEEQTRVRDANGQFLNAKLAEIPGIRPLARGRGETRHSYHLYLFRYDREAFDGVPRDRFLQALRAEGIPCGWGYPNPLYSEELFTERRFGPFTGYRHTRPDPDFRKVSCPVCEKACREESCGLYHTLLLGTREDLDDVVNAVRKIYENRKVLLRVPS